MTANRNCLEIHIGTAGEVNVIGRVPLAVFMADWGCGPGVTPFANRRWLGIVHKDGAFVVPV